MDFHLFKQFLIEQEEAKSEEIRKKEYEAALKATDRSFRDELTTTAHLQKNLESSLRTNADSRTRLDMARIQSQARVEQLDAINSNIEKLRNQMENNVSKVWARREEFCGATVNLSEQCGISALLATRARVELASANGSSPEATAVLPRESHETIANRLFSARQRKASLLEERERLRVEPEKGDEFMRKLLQRNKINFRNVATKIEEESTAPIKFSTSAAAKSSMALVRNPRYYETPWYQPLVVTGSIGVFLLYFCVLREPNDVDVEFEKSLFDRIKGLEKAHLLNSYRYNIDNGLSVDDIERRLREIESSEIKSQ